ncbi:MAG: adenylate/guanylate cyclase domain-containing protein [Candidatus Riflebacteria bacterium]|nr:adenylate/guanylate cyclase domain-containing protein [Candidatus Riflebacteria bacterium]
MFERPSGPAAPLGLLLVVVVGAALAWQAVLLDRLEGDQAAAIRTGRQDELRNLLPLLRRRADPTGLAEEFLHSCLGYLKPGTPAAFRRFERMVRGTYGQDLLLGLWDGPGEGRMVANLGFTSHETWVLIRALNHQYFKENNYWRYSEEATAHLASLTAGISVLRPVHNLATLLEVRFRGRPGLLLLALVTDPARRMNQSLANALTNGQAAPPAPLPVVKARVAMFLPREQYQSRRNMVRAWRSHALARTLPLAAGPVGRLEEWLPLAPGLRSRLKRHLAVRLQGAEVLGETGVVFLQPDGLPGWVMVHRREFPPVLRLARSPGAAGLWVLVAAGLLALVGVRCFRPDWWAFGITWKFLFLVLVIGLVPGLGLAWVSWARSGLEADFRETGQFRACEGQLESLEQSVFQKVQESLAVAKQFVRRKIWLGPLPPRAAIASMVWEANSRNGTVLQGSGTFEIATLYIMGKELAAPLMFNGAPPQEVANLLRQAHLPPRPGFMRRPPVRPPKASAAERTAPFINGLIRFLARSYQMEAASTAGPTGVAKEDLQGGVVFDLLSVLAGKSQLLRIGIQPDRILPFRLLYEVTWALMHIVRDQQRRAIRLFLVILGREQIQTRTFLQLVYERGLHRKDFPECLLMSVLMQRAALVIPEWWDVFPGGIALLRQAMNEQGVQRMVLPRPEGGRVLAMARPLRGMDHVAVSLRRQPEDDPPDPAAFASRLARAYPFLVAVLAVLFFQRFFLRPVRELQRGVETITGGDFEVRLPVVTDDEIGQLCQSFNRMAEGVKEKEFLRRFLSDLAMEAVDDGQATRATRLSGTVLMSDIRKFTTISEEHGPEEVVEMLNAYLTLMEEVIERNGGTIEKFIGDAIMAVFLPLHGRDSPERRAARTGLEMMRALGRFNRDRHKRGKFTIAIGVGIATGELLMGMLGRHDGRRDFTVTGPTVNRAAAMEKVTKQTHHTKLVVCPVTAANLGVGWAVVPLAGPAESPTAFEIGLG